MKLFFLTLFFFILDKLSKFYVIKNFSYNEILYINNYLNIVNYKNTGFILGGFSEIDRDIFVIVNIILFFVVSHYLIKIYSKNKNLFLSISLLLGGAFGNLYDRIFNYGVTDFLDFHYKNIHWPAFNLADLFITSGIIIFIIKSLKESDFVYRNR
tara:strand:- start:430 stop:894 length:465 start_codon:yes stop_codon:yes gene_type:complete